MSASGHVRSNVVGYVALFFALSLGTAYAIDKNEIRSKHIGNGQVKVNDLGNGAVTHAKLAPNSVDGTNVVDDSLKGADVDESSLDLPPPPQIPSTLPPSGAAGGDLSGEYPNPQVSESGLATGGDLTGALSAAQIAGNSVGTNEVDSSLTGNDIVESSLSGIGAGVVSARVNDLPASGTAGGPPVGTSTASAATVSTFQHQSPSVATVARDFSVQLLDNTGFDNPDTRSPQFVVSGGANTICTISAPANSCTASGPITLPANILHNVQVQETGDPPAGQDLVIGYRLVTP